MSEAVRHIKVSILWCAGYKGMREGTLSKCREEETRTVRSVSDPCREILVLKTGAGPCRKKEGKK